MRVRWMLAVLAAVLLFGGLLAVISSSGVSMSFGLPLAVVAWFVAVAIAGVLVAPVALVRRGRPPRPVVAAALLLGGLLVFPVNGSFYTDRGWARENAPDGNCSGLLVLPEAIQNHFTDDAHARFAVGEFCED